MNPLDPDPESKILAADITVRLYREMIRNQDQAAIASLVQTRFEERYLNPVLDSSTKHGFTVLAVCCLMVEALESFRQGSPKTKGTSEGAFRSFFQAYAEFQELQPVAHEFYVNVRNGILHQAETTGGWRVHRQSGPLYKKEGTARWISASEFAERLKRVLVAYCETLKNSEWQSPVWSKARTKLKDICRNCGVADVKELD